VRSAGFTSIQTASMAPASLVRYVIMMYIAIYPLAMSVRSTNVYEEKSLGIYNPQEEVDYDEREFENGENRIEIWGKYLLRHARRQLSFDMWWLALSLFLLCVVERDGLMNMQQSSWFNIFALIFELVSAYGTVGLSLGFPTANYSFSGALHTLSKLILCVVMLRGRHRGLPVALDRAVMLPHEFRKQSQVPDKTDQQRQQVDREKYFDHNPIPLMETIIREESHESGSQVSTTLRTTPVTMGASSSSSGSLEREVVGFRAETV